MPSQLYNNTAVEFIAARNFVFNGVEYHLGETVPQDDMGKQLEVLVRTRRVVPVVEEWGDKPRHWFREVRLKSEVLGKLKTSQGEHLDNRVKQVDTGGPDEIVPGSFNEWDETENAGDVIQEARIRRLEEDVDVARPGKQLQTLVDGKEETEPLPLLGKEVAPEDVEYKEIDQPETHVSEHYQDLYDGKVKAEDVEVAPNVSGQPDNDLFKPAEHSVPEVVEYLDSADEDEKSRVLSEEKEGKQRKGVLGDD